MLDVKRNLTTMTDFYELTMSAGYLDEGYVDKIADVVALADALHLDQGLRGVRGLLPYQAPGNILRKLLCLFRHY